MSPRDGYRSEMKRRKRALSDETVELLLAGATIEGIDDLTSVAEVIEGVRHAAVGDVPRDVAEAHIAAAALAAAEAAASPLPSTSSQGGTSRLTRLMPSIAARVAVGAMLFVGLTTAAAVAGILPDPVQRAFADFAARVGIELPTPEPRSPAPGVAEPGDSTSTSIVDDSTSSSTSSTSEAPLAAPSIGVSLTPTDDEIEEPGGAASFTVEITNTGAAAMTITAIGGEDLGDLLDGDCADTDRSVAPGATVACVFTAEVVGLYGDPEATVEVSVEAVNANGASSAASGNAAIGFAQPTLAASVSIVPTVAAIDEPGGTVTFDVAVTNDSAVDLTLLSLSTSDFGDLFAGGCADLTRDVAAGATVRCAFSGDVTGDAVNGPSRHTATLVAVDRLSSELSVTAPFGVDIGDVLPEVSASVSANQLAVPDTGASVSFTVTVTNTSHEPALLVGLNDNHVGNLLDAANPQVGAESCSDLNGTVEGHSSVTCSYSVVVSGTPGDVYRSTVSVLVRDNEGNPDSATTSAAVAVTEPGTAVTGTVFIDGDADGVFDNGERGLAGARVRVQVPGIGVIAVTTNTSGVWSAVVPPGPVIVAVVDGSVPGASQPTTADAHWVTATSGRSVSMPPVGFAVPIQTVEGRVYVDFNGNGVRDGRDVGVPGASVALYNSAGALIDVATASASGRFTLSGVFAGAVFVEPVAGGLPTGTIAVDQRLPVAVRLGQSATGADLAVRGRNTITEADYSVAPNSTVRLTWAGFDGVLGTSDDVVLTTTSSSTGSYTFFNIPDGPRDIE